MREHLGGPVATRNSGERNTGALAGWPHGKCCWRGDRNNNRCTKGRRLLHHLDGNSAGEFERCRTLPNDARGLGLQSGLSRALCRPHVLAQGKEALADSPEGRGMNGPSFRLERLKRWQCGDRLRNRLHRDAGGNHPQNVAVRNRGLAGMALAERVVIPVRRALPTRILFGRGMPATLKPERAFKSACRHPWPSLMPSLRRAEAARKVLPKFGIATECGLGRAKTPADVRKLIDLHSEVARQMIA